MKVQHLIGMAAGLALACTPIHARTPDNLEDVQREARIVADVVKSSLRNELRDQVRVTSVQAEYLPRQGVLVSVRTNAPWLTIHDGETPIEFNGNIALNEIPALVENILADLQIDVHSYEPEAVGELRALREEQRDLRRQQFDVRAKLRSQRRELVRAEDRKDREDAEEEIAELERELAGLSAQYDALAQDIEEQYDALKEYRGGPSPEPRQPFDDNWAQLMAVQACDYGGTLKSLNSENYLTFAVRGSERTQYFSYKMDHVYSCGRGDMRSERLAELAYNYAD